MTASERGFIYFFMAITLFLIAIIAGDGFASKGQEPGTLVFKDLNDIVITSCTFSLIFTLVGYLYLMSESRGEELPTDQRAGYRTWLKLRKGWKSYSHGFIGDKILPPLSLKDSLLENSHDGMDESNKRKGL